jgi:hypothetical protein
MTTQPDAPHAGAEKIARVTALLQQYPDVSSHELGELKTWFRRQATALDIGILASKEEIAGSYARFREEHIDRFDGKDIGIIIATLAAVAAVIVLIAYWAI